MSIFEVRGGQINRRYLMNKTKDDLASMVMNYLEAWEKSQKRVAELEATPPAGLDELARLERELAEEFAQSIVECHGCPEFVNGERSGWLQCPKDKDGASIFTSSARYLELRGLLERYRYNQNWVRVKEEQD